MHQTFRDSFAAVQSEPDFPRRLGPPIDEIVDHCRVVLGYAGGDRGEAYRWLRGSRPFSVVLADFEREGFSMFQLAGMLVFGWDESLARLALARLRLACRANDPRFAGS
ncbi:MAG TPA: hypothetical protein VFW73_08890 [Lacipirellulaceae bacterium]|nr:hypothetical protein [Lacipirellulaceae bacterium]